MILNNYNRKISDSENFDKYKNHYAIMINDKKSYIRKNKDSYEIYVKHLDLALIFTVFELGSVVKTKKYDIIYGHFYDNEDYFLFKKLKNGKIVNYSIHKCSLRELYHNEKDKLYISNYFYDASNTVKYLEELNSDDTEISKEQASLSLTQYSNEQLKLNSLFSSQYNDVDEQCIITTTNTYKIII